MQRLVRRGWMALGGRSSRTNRRLCERHRSVKRLLICWLVALLVSTEAVAVLPAAAMPAQGTIVSGTGEILYPTVGDPNTLIVSQESHRMIIDWNSFSLGADQEVRFDQAGGSASAVLNRVTGGASSTIAGRITAPGSIFLVNPNGILFSGTATVNVGGLVASALSIANDDFLNDRFSFRLASPESTATVNNQGDLASIEGGYIALLGPQVQNQGGIVAYFGTVMLGAGGAADLVLQTGGLVGMMLGPDSPAAGPNQLISNTGTIEAEGGLVHLSAAARNHFVGNVISQHGTVRAGTAHAQAGRVILEATGAGDVSIGSGAVLAASGTVDIVAPNDVVIGGTIRRPTLDDYPNPDDDPFDDDIEGLGDITLRAGGSGTGDGTVRFISGGGIDWSTGEGDVIILYNPVAAGTGSHKYENPSDFGAYVTLPTGGFGALLPYMLVNNVQDLQDMSANVAGSYALGGDIDATESSAWNLAPPPPDWDEEEDGPPPQVWLGFNPIGAEADPFVGVLDGRGHVIEGLFINRDDTASVGLFSSIGAAGRVVSLGLENVDIRGQSHVGGLAGRNQGEISRTYVTGAVAGHSATGGLVGSSTGTIRDTYSVAGVTGMAFADDEPDAIGGLVGELGGAGRLIRSYSMGTVTAAPDATAMGALIGRAVGMQAAVEGSFWNTDVTGTLPGIGAGLRPDFEVIGLAESQIRSAQFWAEGAWSGTVGWDIDATGHPEQAGSVWRLYDGETAPQLKDFLRVVSVRAHDVTVTYDGQQHGAGSGYAISLPGATLLGQVAYGGSQRNAGTYDITLGGLYSTGQRGYDIRFMPGTLTIAPRSIRIIVDPGQEKVYGEQDPTFTFTHEADVVAGDSLTFTGALARLPADVENPGNDEGVGSYVIGLGNLASANSNYAIEGFDVGSFEIRPRPITIEVIEKERVKQYGTSLTFGGKGVGWRLTGDSPYGLVGSDTLSGGLHSDGAALAAPVRRNVAGEVLAYEIGHTLHNENYEITFVGGTLKVLPRTLTVTLNAPGSKIYGEPNPQYSVTYSGFVSQVGDGEQVLEGLLTYSGPERYAPVNESGYTVMPQGLTANNYDLEFVGGTLYIQPRPVTVRVQSFEKEYGEAVRPEDVTLLYDACTQPCGLVNGDTLTGQVASDGFAAEADVLWEHGHVAGYAISGAALSNPNYQVHFADSVVRVTPAPLQVIAEDKRRYYGDNNPVFTVRYSGFKLGQSESDLSGTLTFNHADLPVQLAANPAGYDITPSGLSSGNYDIAFVPGKLVVDRRPITVRLLAEELEKQYGEAVNPGDVKWVVSQGSVVGNDELTGLLASEGFAAAAPVLYDSSGEVTHYTVGAGTLTNANNPNYDITFVPGRLFVKPGVLRVIAQDAWRYYGDGNQVFSVAYDGFELDDADRIDEILDGRLEFDAPGASAPVRYDPVTGEVVGYSLIPKGLSAANYTLEFVPGTLTIRPRPVTVALANPNLTKVYGDLLTPSPALWYIHSGNLVLGDQLQGSLASDGFAAAAPVRDAQGDVISYPITLGTLGNPNYHVNFLGGTLTVTPAPLTITAGNVTRLYGDDNPHIPVTYEGFKLGEDASVLHGELGLVTVGRTADVQIGGYPITPGGYTSENYTIHYVRGTLTIEPAPLVVTARDASRLYGSANPAFEVDYDGFRLGQDESVLSGRLIVSSAARDAGVNDEGYAITPSGLRSTNYDVQFVDGTLTILPAPLQIRAENLRRRFGVPNPPLVAVFDGFVLDDDPSVLEGELYLRTAAGRLSRAGEYAIEVGGQWGPNYDVEFVDGVLTVYLAPGDIHWPEELRTSYSSSQAEVAALGRFGGVNLDCIDPADGAKVERQSCLAF